VQRISQEEEEEEEEDLCNNNAHTVICKFSAESFPHFFV
jgi:hypothetical protein